MSFEGTLKNIISSCFFLQTPDKAYYSEASVKLRLGIEIYKHLKIEPILEYKIKSKKEYLDIFYQYNRHRYGIELKYKTSKVQGFEYTTQAAHNNAKYDFLRDIQRLESLLRSGKIDTGFCIFITNEKLYWLPARKGTKVKKFDLVNNNNSCLPRTFTPEWKGRKDKIHLCGEYKIKWIPEEKENQSACAFFRSCMVKVHGKA